MSMTSSNSDIVQKLWNLCDVLRDDGINYSDYVTELVLLLFIKMVHENSEAGLLSEHTMPIGCRWGDLSDKDGINLLNDYKNILMTLSTGKRREVDPEDPKNTIEKTVVTDPLILAIYADAQTRLREPRHLKQLIKSLDSINWFDAQKDGLGDLYEGLLEKNANETKSGAGQYFTPRALIDSIVRCVKPKAGELIQDPAAGTAGFLISAHKYIKDNTDELYDLTGQNGLPTREDQIKKNYIGVELVPNTRRLALMNCLLNGIEGGKDGAIQLGNALGEAGVNLKKANVILANPPFGTSKGGDASITRKDLTYPTSNKQLAFLQHIYRNLKAGGRAAVVLPDNVLFEAGVGTDIRRDLMNKCNLNTILRLPTGIFYAAGVKTNVLFFTKGSETDKLQEENCTKNTWVYDLRTNMPSFGKRTPFGEQHLKPFEAVYNIVLAERKEGEWSFVSDTQNGNKDTSRWKCFSRKYISETKGDSLDISWVKDADSVDAADLGTPEELAGEAMTELKGALADLEALVKSLGSEKKSGVKG
ncbi:N-6 DNA methylase [Shewanella kaireitica]|uniref:class I SAM-dependent DNA methyltransferase n=1 Tax=Shewanella kaireitica TaxID=212021 RepID=UPI00200E7F06|nr:N-6 DNA methylase [Shewanella kaireitica]MCL1095911.1 type I restriction-modification system subunit M [Shewanella kaireitica]